MEMQKKFATPDLYLASSLTLFLSKPPQYQYTNGKILFTFDSDDNLYRALEMFNGGAPLNAYLLTQTIKRLRGEMIVRKNMAAEQREVGHE